MGVYDRYKSKKGKEETVSPVNVQSEAVEEMPSEELSVTEINTPSPLDNSAIVETGTEQQAQPASVASAPALAPVSIASVASSNAPVASSTIPKPSIRPAWINAKSFEEAAKIDPKISRGQYAYEVSKYRREQGQPDMSYAEWANIIKGNDPYETEEQRLKREKNMKTARQINALGTFINALVNYNRVKRGHVGYTPDKGTDTYNRLERIRAGQEQLAQSRAKDYLGALAKDRAERAKAEASAVAARQAERNYQLKVKDLEWKMENAKTEAARKQAADELAREKFEWQQQKEDRNFEEKQRSNKANEAIRRERASKTGSGNKKYLELQTGNGVKQYTPEEYGSNWVHKAYQDMLKEPGGKEFAVHKYGGFMGGSSVPSEQEMYEAITRYNDSQWKNRYKSNRYGGKSKDNPPLE